VAEENDCTKIQGDPAGSVRQGSMSMDCSVGVCVA
jgi:hypothetical protein